jgi:hypothetical protein
VFLAVRRKDRSQGPSWTPKSLDPSYLLVRSAMRGEFGSDPVTHLIPAEGEGEYLTLCCKSDPFALIAEHHVMVVRPEQVTCDRSGGEA